MMHLMCKGADIPRHTSLGNAKRCAGVGDFPKRLDYA